MEFTLDLDLSKEVPNAPEIVQRILAEKSMSVGDKQTANTKSFLNWLITDVYLKKYQKDIGFTENIEFWPKQKHADILLNKVELISTGLTQKWDVKKKRYVPLPIKNAVIRRFHYDNNKRKIQFGILPEGKLDSTLDG